MENQNGDRDFVSADGLAAKHKELQICYADEEVVNEEEIESESSETVEVDYSSLTVSELKELLKAAGKPVSGKKAELIDRLNE